METFELENADLAGGCCTTVMPKRRAQGKGLSFTQNQSHKNTWQGDDFCFWWGRLWNPLCSVWDQTISREVPFQTFSSTNFPTVSVSALSCTSPSPPWCPYLHNKPVLDQFICFRNGWSKTQEEKPALQNLLMEIQRRVFQSSLKDSTVLRGNQECSQETSRYTSRELFLLLNGQLKPLLYCHISMSLQSQ